MSISKDFTGKNLATVVANFHGHLHSLYVTDISGTTVKRIAIPNACFGRNNEYGTEATTYNKVDNGTGKNTAFNVVSIDLTKKIIYADCFGAGYDRVVSYGEKVIITYSVTNNLSHAKNSNGLTIVTEGASYSAVITAEDGYTLDSVTVTMGGMSVPVENGAINIQSVTGEIVITATTTKNAPVYNVTNLVPTSLAADGSVYNGVGYKDDTYISSGGAYSADTTAGCTATGFIPYKSGDVIYTRGCELKSGGRSRLYFQESVSSASAVALFASNGLTETAWSVSNANGTFTFQVEKLADKYYKLTPDSAMNSIVDADDVYRLSLYGKGEDLIITHNEPIE